MIMDCEHFFGISVKDENGIPYDYQHGCWVNENYPENCGKNCPMYEPTDLGPVMVSYESTASISSHVEDFKTSSPKKFGQSLLNKRKRRK